MKYGDYLVEWFTEHRKTIKESTGANYSLILYDYIMPRFKDIEIKEITHKDIQDYLYDLAKNGRVKKQGGLSKSTIKKVIIIIKLSLSQAAEDEIIKPINLKFNYPPDYSVNKISVFTKEEQIKLYNYLSKKKNNKDIGILIALLTGVRIGELCALQWKDIDLKNKTISITKTVQRMYQKNEKEKKSEIIITSPKTKKSIRDVPMSDVLYETLKDIKMKEDEYILSEKKKPYEPRTIRQYYTRLLKKIGLPKLKFHCLRHTFATNCIELGMDTKTVSEILGHSTVSTTLDLYVHTKLSQRQECVNLVSNYIKPKKAKQNEIEKYKKTNILIYCQNKKTSKIDFVGSIMEVSKYTEKAMTKICNDINGIENDEVYNFIPEIQSC